MPRIRTIKPSFWTDSKVAKLSHSERLLFIGLWNFADDTGYLRDNSDELRACIFPYEARLKVSSMLSSLENKKLILRYQVEGENYISICNFLKHQNIDRPGPSSIPPPIRRALDEPSTSPRRVLDESSTSPRRALDEDSLLEGKGKEKEEERKGSPLIVPPKGGFDVFWKAYPKKVGKGAAMRSWEKAKKRPEFQGVDETISAIEAQKRWERWKEGYIPNPATWLNQLRWLDEEDTYGRDKRQLGQGAAAFSRVASSIRERKGGEDMPDPGPSSGGLP